MWWIWRTSTMCTTPCRPILKNVFEAHVATQIMHATRAPMRSRLRWIGANKSRATIAVMPVRHRRAESDVAMESPMRTHLLAGFRDDTLGPVLALPLLVGWCSAAVQFGVVALSGRLTVGMVLLTIAAGVVATWRPRPMPASAVVLVVLVVANELVTDPASIATMVFAYAWVFAVSVESPRREAVVAAAVIGGALGIAPVLDGRSASDSLWMLVYALWAATAAGVGTSIRAHRMYVESIEDRAEHAERTKRETALRYVAEERLRIARDLHDALAHHIAVMSMQINVARARMIRSGDGAQTADAVLDEAQQAAGAVIQELQEILSVLRAEDVTADPAAAGDGAAHLEELFRPFAVLPTPPTLVVRGEPVNISPSVENAVYRVVQESLTNAQKHGVGAAAVSVYHIGDGAVTVTVVNRVPAGPRRPVPSDEGYGLVGMAERVRAAGGTLTTGTEDDRFVVRAEFPPRGRSARAPRP